MKKPKKPIKIIPLPRQVLVVGEYTITRCKSYLSQDAYYIRQDGGEGMETSADKFEKLIADFYAKEF